MAKLKINTIELVAAKSRKAEIIDYLQRRGVVELKVPKETDGVTLKEYTAEISSAEQKLAVLKAAELVLHTHAPQKKPLTAMLQPRKEMSVEEYNKLSSFVPQTLKECEQLIEDDKKAGGLKADAVRFKTLADGLLPWKNTDIPVKCGATKNVAYLLGSIRGKVTRDFLLTLLAENLPENEWIEIEIISTENLLTCIAVFCMKQDADAVEGVLRGQGFIRAPECADCTPAEKIAELEAQIDECEDRAQQIYEEIAEKTELYDKIAFAEDYYEIAKDKLSAYGKLAETQRVFCLNGYIAARDAKKITEYCEQHFDAAVETSEPEKDEEVPVILSNNVFSAPLEGITGMYSLPSGYDSDPTGIMAFFYYFFFGMMFSDAGYGLIMVIGTGLLLILKKNLEQKWKNTLRMYLFCGISTVFWGAMYGSWFGDAGLVICREFFGKNINPLPPLWVDPIGKSATGDSNLMKVLVVCFIFGLVHLFTGVAIKAVTDWKNGNKFEAFCNSVPTYLTILGIAPIFFNLFTEVPPVLSTIATPLLIVGLVLVVLTGGRSSKSIGGKIGGGLYEVYNLVGGYLGDVLSYARLLALGLATGVIAQVMNMLGTLPQNPTVKLLMFIPVFIIGHIANLGINVIGAYVHTNRLQYVEFFGKFYEGGGRAFVPLKAATNNYKFKEEN